MLKQFLRRLILSQLVAASGGDTDLGIFYWDLVYWYKFGIPEYRGTQGPRPNETVPLTTDILEIHEELLFSLVDAYAGDLSPQPSLHSLLLDKSVRLAAARDVAVLFERGLQSMNEEITRLEQESKVK